ncbi:MAG: glycosyltransferase [Bacteroidales bacterium]
MKLSVIIVNYNVEHFLEQCLHSVRKACEGIESEIWVVDNASADGSLRMLREKFPEVKVIANKENVGFARANNQAIRAARGEYILLLNPDTVVEEDTFMLTLTFMDEHPEAGGLGVKMVDGKGRFLRESKRGLPTPGTALYKIIGLASLFPRSPVFARYYMGHLSDDDVHEVEILAGAFMLLRKSVLDEIGLLDEDYFMYGEDVDLSYRILMAGYKNYYYPHTRIIHYKGESTRKSSVNYVFTFYQAMAIFARKHFSAGLASRFIILINLAIFARASLSVMRRIFQGIFLPLLDATLLYGGIFIMKGYWEAFIFQGSGHYPAVFVYLMLPVYIFIWLFSVYLSGGYDRPFRLTRVLQGMLLGTVFILTGYALLNEELRFSRALILFGALWGILSLTLTRLILHYTGWKDWQLWMGENKRVVIVGNEAECNRVADILRSGLHRPAFIGFVAIDSENENRNGFIGNATRLDEITRIYSINEVVFCAADLSAQSIIDHMMHLQGRNLEFKTAPPESFSVIGSNSINLSADPFIIDLNSLTLPRNRRNKRLADIGISLALLIVLPYIIWKVDRKAGLLCNIIRVMLGRCSWVGISQPQAQPGRLILRRGVLHPTDAWSGTRLQEQTARNLEMLYVRNYRMHDDLTIVIRSLRYLGRKCQ